jgi:hypothetical protein
MSAEDAWFSQLQRSEKNIRLITRLYQEAQKELIRLGYSVKFDPKKPFRFSDYPTINRRVQKLLKDLHSNLTAVIVNGTSEAWHAANLKNDKLVERINKTFTIPKEKLAQYENRNLESLETFQARKVSGMNLSERVWNLTGSLQQELEMALDVGLLEGKSAQELSRDVREYLNEPDKLFRRVRDKRGVLQLSKNAKAYHPGKGVYRSSYKNAQRLTRTENNMAYRTSDHERWKKLDFVVGFEQKRSNHKYDCEVCDAFVGEYPKSYHFRSVHPHCRCVAVPILASSEEMEAFFDAQINGEEFELRSKNEVKTMPKGYTDWMKANEKRILKASKPPYFILDNYKGGDILKGLKFELP